MCTGDKYIYFWSIERKKLSLRLKAQQNCCWTDALKNRRQLFADEIYQNCEDWFFEIFSSENVLGLCLSKNWRRKYKSLSSFFLAGCTVYKNNQCRHRWCEIYNKCQTICKIRRWFGGPGCANWYRRRHASWVSRNKEIIQIILQTIGFQLYCFVHIQWIKFYYMCIYNITFLIGDRW